MHANRLCANIMKVLALWEAIWAQHRTQHFELFVVVAILDLYAPEVMRQAAPDNILEQLTQLSMRMDVRDVLGRARQVGPTDT